ncbi:hypothetical protein D3C81_1052560 [compost metagenome]
MAAIRPNGRPASPASYRSNPSPVGSRAKAAATLRVLGRAPPGKRRSPGHCRGQAPAPSTTAPPVTRAGPRAARLPPPSGTSPRKPGAKRPLRPPAVHVAAAVPRRAVLIPAHPAPVVAPFRSLRFRSADPISLRLVRPRTGLHQRSGSFADPRPHSVRPGR